MQDRQKIGVLGLGAIATALVEGIASDGHHITVSTRSRENSARLAERFANVHVAENQDVADASDILFLGLPEDVARETLGTLRFRKGQQVIALMADLRFETTAALVAPATMAARMIPFPAIATGGSPILTYGKPALVDGLFGARNTIFHLEDENELALYLCAQAVLSPALCLVQEAAGWAGDRGTAPRDKVETFLRTLVGSSLLGSPCAELLHALDTPGGYNRRLRQKMIDGGLARDLREGLDGLLD